MSNKPAETWAQFYVKARAQGAFGGLSPRPGASAKRGRPPGALFSTLNRKHHPLRGIRNRCLS